MQAGARGSFAAWFWFDRIGLIAVASGAFAAAGRSRANGGLDARGATAQVMVSSGKILGSSGAATIAKPVRRASSTAARASNSASRRGRRAWSRRPRAPA